MTEKSVLKQIAELDQLPVAELKDRWRALYGGEPPAHNRSHLVKRLAYRIQELVYGGVSEATRVRLREHLEEAGLAAEGTDPAHTARRRHRNGQPVVGTQLVREWRGERHEVTVVDDGFEYAGKPYRSLTAVTKSITGAHWNGPAFFGLRKPGRKKR